MAKKLRRGDHLPQIPAHELNAALDAGQDFVRRQRSLSSSPLTGPAESGTIALIQNASGYDQAAFNVLGIDGPLVTAAENLVEFQSRVMFTCSTPQPNHVGKFVILQEPIPAGGIGRALVSGVTLARVVVGISNASAATAGPIRNDASKLQAGIAGTALLWREPGYGLKWAVVRIADGGLAPARMLVKTCKKDSGTSYPTDKLTNTFWFKFLVPEWLPASEGDRDPTYTDLRPEVKSVAHSRAGRYYPEDSVVAVDWINGQWWIDDFCYRQLARTCKKDSGTPYPTSSACDTYWCELIAGSYPAAEGNQTATYVAHSPTEKVLAHNRHGHSFAEGTVVEIDFFDGQWWIDHDDTQPAYCASFRVSADTVAAGGTIAPLVDVYRDPANDGLPSGVAFAGTGLTFEQAGSYLVGFSTSFLSLSAPRGSLLVLRLYLDGVATQYCAVRAQDIEEDHFGVNTLITFEQVSVCGPLQIGAGKILSLVNESAYEVIATPTCLWAVQLFPHNVA